MPGLDHRRVFLCLLLLLSADAAASPAAHAADGDSLWDVLSRTEHTNLDPAKNAALVTDLGQSPRRALGPVPGFTLPLNQDADADQVFAGRPKRKKSGMFGGLGDWWSRMEQKTGTKITASGHQTLSFRYDNVTGNQSAYDDSQYNGQGTNGIYNDTQLDVDATLFNALHYHTQISNSPYRNPNDNRVKLDYNTKKMRVEWGDINPTMAGNSLIDFNRSLHGIQVTNNWTPGLKSTLLYSQTRAETRTIVIAGNGSTGPYYVYAGQIVDGSVHVRVDNKDLVQGADRDYTLDLYTGQLNFTNGNVILPSSSIAVSFEALDYSATQGTIYGARTEFAATRTTNFGFTYLTQTSPTVTTLKPITDQINIASLGVPGQTIYSTQQLMDPSKGVIVKIDDVLTSLTPVLTSPNIPYTNRFFLPIQTNPGQVIKVTYTPYDPNPTPGNRSIMGVDGRIGLGALGSVSLESAFSGLALSGLTHDGQALQVIANLTPFKNLHTRLTLKDVSPSFSSIQSPGFNLNEKSVNLDADFQATKKLDLTLNWQKAKRPSYSSVSTAGALTSAGNDDYNQYSLGANYHLTSAATLSLSRSSLGTNYILGGNNTNTNDNLSLNYTKGQLNVQTALGHTVSNVSSSYLLLGLTSPTGNQNDLISSGSSTTTERFSTQWQPAKWLTLGGSYSNNAIRSTGASSGVSTTARDTAFDADFRLIRNVHLHYNYDLSDTGNLSALNTTTTTGTTTTGSTTTGSTTTGSTSGSTAGTTGSTVISRSASGLVVDPARFAFLAAQGFPITRDTTTPVTTTTGITTGLLGGGGVNDGLGGAGNYSGGVGSTSSLYGATSYGGKSATNRVSLDYSPRPGMQVGLHINNSSSIGDYQYNSNSNGLGGSFNWDLSKRIHLNAVYEVQKLAYTNTSGGSNTTTSVLSLNGRPFGGKLEVELSWQSSNTASSFALTSGSTSATDTSTDLTAIRLGLSYRISSRQSLFTEFTSSNSSGYYTDKESALSFGMDYDLTQQLAFRFGWQFRNRLYSTIAGSSSTSSTSNLNYSANSLLAEFNLHF